MDGYATLTNEITKLLHALLPLIFRPWVRHMNIVPERYRAPIAPFPSRPTKPTGSFFSLLLLLRAYRMYYAAVTQIGGVFAAATLQHHTEYGTFPAEFGFSYILVDQFILSNTPYNRLCGLVDLYTTAFCLPSQCRAAREQYTTFSCGRRRFVVSYRLHHRSADDLKIRARSPDLATFPAAYAIVGEWLQRTITNQINRIVLSFVRGAGGDIRMSSVLLL